MFSGIKDVLTDYVSTEDKILNVGCGNSSLSKDMFDEGYERIANIDWSVVCIDYMRDKYETVGPDFYCKLPLIFSYFSID